QALDHLLPVPLVAGLEGEVTDDRLLADFDEIDRADVAAGLTDRGGDFAQHPRLVLDLEPNRERVTRRRSVAHLPPPCVGCTAGNGPPSGRYSTPSPGLPIRIRDSPLTLDNISVRLLTAPGGSTRDIRGSPVRHSPCCDANESLSLRVGSFFSRTGAAVMRS